ncbi:malto-oligosyltrehalose trehalohydrolase [Aquipseudomonas campi]
MYPVTRSHGALLQEDGTTRFALWAPNGHEVAVELGDGTLHPLREHIDGWFSNQVDCAAGTSYRYLIDGHLHVPDPASRAQVEDVHGFSQVVDPHSYAWRTANWRGRAWHETVIYEVHVGLLGGFAGVEAHLPNLLELGVTAIELMPLAGFSGLRNWGYDSVLPFAPESAYGTPDELKSLIDSAHAMGLMIFVDVVYNHFGSEGNYLGQYASDFFRQDLQTPWGAAIDFRRVQVRDFFCENALMWLLDYRVDGLRLDAVHAIVDRDFLVELAQRVRKAVEPGRHIHLMLENENNDIDLLQHGFDAQWNDDGHNVLYHLLTGERDGYYADFAQEPARNLARCLKDGFIYQGRTDHGRNQGYSSANLEPTAFILFLQNHGVSNRAVDERLINLADENALKAATALLLLAPMVPLLFFGEEWGSHQPLLFFSKYQDTPTEAVRDTRRHQADREERQRLISAQANRPLAIPDHDPGNQPQQRHWRSFYRRLLYLRHAQIIPRLPGTRALNAEVVAEHAVCALWRLGDGCRLHIDINLGNTPAWVGPQALGSTVLLAQGVEPEVYRQGSLPPRSAVVLLEDPA